MKRRVLSYAVLAVALLPCALLAQGFWAKKDYREWNARECEKMLTDSPWARTRTIGQAVIQRLEARDSIDANPRSVEGREERPEVTYVVQLWSALPVRQASVRRAQLAPSFAKLTEGQQAELKASHAKLLAAEFPDRVVIKVLYGSNVTTYQYELVRYWQKRPANTWSQDTFLITSAGRVPPMEVRVEPGAGGEFDLFFPRQVNGKPILEPGEKQLALEFESPAVGQIRNERVLLEFKVKDMLLNGRLVY